MMKIHTTQNLGTAFNQPTNVSQSHYKDSIRHRGDISVSQDYYSGNISFKGKKSIVDKVIETAKKAARKKKTESNSNPSGFYNGNKFKEVMDKLFDGFLDIMSHEVLIQAMISALVCIILRPLTIMSIPTKKNKQDNQYASAHSISSGVVGIIASLLITTPFSKGVRYAGAKKNLTNLSEDFLKKYYPNLNINSIYSDASKKIRKPIEEWLDIEGRIFSPEFKDVLKIAKPKHASTIAESTWKSIGVDVDVAAMKDKSLNNWITRNGKSLRDAVETKDMFIAIKEEGVRTYSKETPEIEFFSLKFIDKDFLVDVIKDLPEGHPFKKLDVNSIDENGVRLHPSQWKNIDGSNFVMDMDMVHISSFHESKDAVTPIYTGRKRVTIKKGKEVEKYCSYQKNNGIDPGYRVPDELGSEITQECLDADKEHDVLNKFLVWTPDILTRAFVATATIAIIPMVLKQVFHLEKPQKSKPNKEQAPVLGADASRKEVA